MAERYDPVTRLFSALDEQEPSRLLRERSLARPPATDPSSRRWYSRPLRLAWAATVVVLVAANVALRVGPQARPGIAASGATSRERVVLEEMQAIVELPRLRPEYAGMDAPQAQATRPGDSNLATQHHEMEDKS